MVAQQLVNRRLIRREMGWDVHIATSLPTRLTAACPLQSGCRRRHSVPFLPRPDFLL
jgi:hypothetical protein